MRRETDPESLEYFQNILNAAQPVTNDELVLSRFVKYLYNENKHKFTSFIKKTNYECLMLWTESKYIVQHFGLKGRVYIKWVDPVTLYIVQQFKHSDVVDVSANLSMDHQQVDVDEKLRLSEPVLVEIHVEKSTKQWGDESDQE
jgi:hypothetical protein